MPSGYRLCLVLSFLAPSWLLAAEDDENWARLRGIPREYRQTLSDKLRDFDRLSSSDQAAIRSLDQQISSEAPATRASYLSVIHRYHLWLASLPPDQRKLIEDTPPDRRMAVVSKIRAKNKSRSAAWNGQTSLQLAGPSPINLARRLQTWINLSAKDRVEMEKLDPAARQQRFKSLVRPKDLRHIPQLTPEQIEDSVKKMRTEPHLEAWITQIERDAANKAATANAPPKKAANTTKKAEAAKAHGIPPQLHALAENYHFLIDPPKKVDPTKLLLFEAELPQWFRAAFDHFSPEEAKRRLTILYRLIYGDSDDPGAKPPASPRPARDKPPAQKPKASPAKGASPTSPPARPNP